MKIEWLIANVTAVGLAKLLELKRRFLYQKMAPAPSQNVPKIAGSPLSRDPTAAMSHRQPTTLFSLNDSK